MAAPKGNKFASAGRKAMSPMERFLSFCEFDAATGCVIWTGGKDRSTRDAAGGLNAVETVRLTTALRALGEGANPPR